MGKATRDKRDAALTPEIHEVLTCAFHSKELTMPVKRGAAKADFLKRLADVIDTLNPEHFTFNKAKGELSSNVAPKASKPILVGK